VNGGRQAVNRHVTDGELILVFYLMLFTRMRGKWRSLNMVLVVVRR
jgi:hypothetical protein